MFAMEAHPEITIELLIEATLEAISKVRNPRYFCSERGYQGQFYCQLQSILEEQNIITADLILEMEYQKQVQNHHMTQRPDIILHIPSEVSGASSTENNFCVWALKRGTNSTGAREDFEKLNMMMEVLNYPVGIFINIDSGRHFLESYDLSYKNRIAAISVLLQDDVLLVNVATFQNDELNVTPYRM